LIDGEGALAQNADTGTDVGVEDRVHVVGGELVDLRTAIDLSLLEGPVLRHNSNLLTF
jgi:hypothetical protein